MSSISGIGQSGFQPVQTGTQRGSSGSKAESLSDDEKKQVQELQNRDREVRTHESAHSAAGGQYVRGGASYSYQQGPDGRQYAIGGEVSIDTSPISGDPQATIMKMQTVIRAALAPASPSGQDRSVAASAQAALAKATQELTEQRSAGGTLPKGRHAPSETMKTYTPHGKPQQVSKSIPSLDLII